MTFNLKELSEMKARPPQGCSVCNNVNFFKYTRSWFSPVMFEVTGELVCMSCIRKKLAANGLLSSQQESGEL